LNKNGDKTIVHSRYNDLSLKRVSIRETWPVH